MKVKPMIFNTEMVWALMDGKKTQTRRPFTERTVKLFKYAAQAGECSPFISVGQMHANDETYVLQFAPVATGDLIYVRETFRLFDSYDECDHADFPCPCPGNGAPIYFASCRDSESNWKPSIHMPRWASRTTLKVTRVRVERIQDISEDDAIAEGFKYTGWRPTYSDPDSGGEYSTASDKFADTWISIYGDHWDSNGWCWVIDFEVIHQNVDSYLKNLEAA